jgi:hypothetical protein
MGAPLLWPVSMACGEQVDALGLSLTGVEGGARAPYVRWETSARFAKDTLIWACKYTLWTELAEGYSFTCEGFSCITGMNSPLKIQRDEHPEEDLKSK